MLNLSLVSVLHATPKKNGFDLAGSLIPIDKILHGGPSKDGIPAIDQPHFIKAKQANFLNVADRIIGIEINGVQRAYPIKILNWHEIVNDHIGNRAIVITYCPLCGTGVVYDANIKGKTLQFGVSGLLYNSDVLLYDRQTESLWSQILSKSISSKYKNTPLSIISSSHTSWGKWQQQHPNTLVLSTKTGYQRNYNRSPYGDYNRNQTIYFPISAKSKRYHPKERVLGISLNGIHKAYPFIELAKNNSSVITDQVAGKTLHIRFDINNRDGKITDPHGNTIPSINSFWFAWYAFHPNSKVYKVK
jgi:hypothetical protein